MSNKIVVLASEPVGGRSQAIELPCLKKNVFVLISCLLRIYAFTNIFRKQIFSGGGGGLNFMIKFKYRTE